LTGKGKGMKRILFSLVVMLLPMAAIPSLSAQTATAPPSPCHIHREPCSRPLSRGTGTVTLDIRPKPVRAMADLIFMVRLAGVTPEKPPFIDLGMPGMEMGPNRVPLKPRSDGAFTGSGIIVRCPSGRTLWRATVVVPGAGAAEFLFHAVY
jgi:hypothetical protein